MSYQEYVPGDTNPDPENEFRKRGIREDVWRDRYRRYTKNHAAEVREHNAELKKTKQLSWLMGIVNQSPGWMCIRHAPPGIPLPADFILPQERPDTDVVTGPAYEHAHPYALPADRVIPSTFVGKDGEPGKNYGQPLWDSRVYTAKQMRKHIARTRSKIVYDPVSGIGDHHGGNVEGSHKHVPTGKYVFPPGENRAKRLDVHPLALPLFESASRVFFVLEGQWKADAILSRGEAVFSCPSVTLWDAPELLAFAGRYLRGKLVAIVVDADGHENPLVMSQAWYCKTFLESLGLGLRVCISAPDDERDAAGELRHKGVDDLLGVEWDGIGSGRYDLEGLHVFERDKPDLSAFQAVQKAHGITGFDLLRNCNMLEFLALHAGFNGELPRTLKTISRMMAVDGRSGTDPRTARKTLLALEGLGALDIEGDDDASEGRRLSKKYVDAEFGWVYPPLITIRPEYRAAHREPIGLGEWCKGTQGSVKTPSSHTVEGRNLAVNYEHLIEGLSLQEIAASKELDERHVRRITKDLREFRKLLRATVASDLRDEGTSFASIASQMGTNASKARSLVNYYRKEIEPIVVGEEATQGAAEMMTTLRQKCDKSTLVTFAHMLAGTRSFKTDTNAPIEQETIRMTSLEYQNLLAHAERLEEQVSREFSALRDDLRERFPDHTLQETPKLKLVVDDQG